MSDCTWECVPDAASVVGGLTRAQIDQVEGLAARIADAVAVRRIGTPFDAAEAVSSRITGTMSFSWCGSSTSSCLIPLADRTGTGTV